MDQKVSDLVFETNISKFLRRIKLIFTPNILILKLLDFIRQKLFSLYKYDFAITGGAVSSESFKKSKVKFVDDVSYFTSPSLTLTLTPYAYPSPLTPYALPLTPYPLPLTPNLRLL